MARLLAGSVLGFQTICFLQTPCPTFSMTQPSAATNQPLPINTAHKYDRQIRIWGEHGQARLQAAAVCLINASATGTEALKNLVLPGIGSFTIIDGQSVTDADRASNFFLASRAVDPAKPPPNRAFSAMEALQELNDSVEASYIPEDVSTFITSEATSFHFFRHFSLVIVSQLGTGHSVLKHIAAGCYRANIPLIIIRSYGLVGYLRIQVKEHFILDTKEENVLPDLRLHDPFPELEKFTSATDLSKITDTTQISHVPFVTILAQVVQRFRRLHDGKLPRSRPEKNEFRDLVKASKPALCPDMAANFEEAVKSSNLRLCYQTAAEIPFALQAVLNDEKCNLQVSLEHNTSPASEEKMSFPDLIRFTRRPSISSLIQLDVPELDSATSIAPRRGADRIEYDTAWFWIHVAAVKRFLEEEGTLPVIGSLPDMTADTKSYIDLQKIYSDKARADATHVLKYAQENVERLSIGVECNETMMREFCKKLQGVRVCRTRMLSEEMEKPKDGEFSISASMEGAMEAASNGCAAPYYALFRAVDLFYREHGRHAGSDQQVRADDTALVNDYFSKVKDQLGLPNTSALWRDEADEMVRYAGTELHNVASFMGGVAGQEATKILTRQFVPIENTLVVNFASQSSVTFAA